LPASQTIAPESSEVAAPSGKEEEVLEQLEKAKAKISRVHSKIANRRMDFVHKASQDISKNHAVVFVEDLLVRKLSASARGTREKPGKGVARKSGLNRSILDASPFELRRQLEYS
jgi:putative transposase